MMTVQHGGNIWAHTDKILDFSASLSPLGMPNAVYQAAVRGIMDSSHYPDPECTRLRKAISVKNNVLPEWIICGNGAAELLDRMALCFQNCKVLLLAPSFSEYERSFSAFGCKCKFFYLKPKEEFCITEHFFTFLRPDLDLIVLCNPNNPTGKTISFAFFQRLLSWCKKHHVRLLVDESFLELTDEEKICDLVPLLNQYSELLLLRSMTKSYCMPGLRLGYLLSSDIALLQRMQNVGQPWSVSIPAQYAGAAAVSECAEWPSLARPLISEQRMRLITVLKELNCIVFDSSVNYLLFQIPGMYNLRERLLKHGILIRSCGSFRGLSEDYYRIAVRTAEENTIFINTLRQVMQERK